MDRYSVADSAADAADHAKKTVESFADDAKGTAEELARGARDTYTQVRGRVADAASVINESVQHQPLVALLAGGILGCMLCLLLARR